MVDNKQKMKMADLQIENFKHSITHSELTASELKSLPEETRLYESVGRMFLLSSSAEVSEMLKKRLNNFCAGSLTKKMCFSLQFISFDSSQFFTCPQIQ